MIVKINDKEYNFDGYVHPINSIQKLVEEIYQQGYADGSLSVTSEILEHNDLYQMGRADERPKAFANGYEKGYQQGGADAIEEFANKIKEYSGEHYLDCDGYGCQTELVFRTEEFLDDILEQLKEQKKC